MNKECELVRDLLPLYVENACSRQSADIVSMHLKCCPECNKIYQEMCEKAKQDLSNDDTHKMINAIKHLKRVRIFKKIATKLFITILLFCATIASIIGTFFGVLYILDNIPVKLEIDYGMSEMYTKEEMDTVIEMIKSRYTNSNLKLVEIEYTSDEICKRELIYYNNRDHKRFEYCMVFRVTFRASYFGDYFYEPNQIDQIGYWYAKKADGEWKQIGSGRPVP